MMSSHESSGSSSEDETEQRNLIREDLGNMTFEEILKLKEELGSKVYNEAILGHNKSIKRKNVKNEDHKRLNKNRPRELSSKRQVPFLGAELRTQPKSDKELRDPRFDERSGTYEIKRFKDNYKFLTKIRKNEVKQLKNSLALTEDEDTRINMKKSMQKLINKNEEERKWHDKQTMLKKEKIEIQKARVAGEQPHFVTKKERRTKELVQQFEHLKQTGKLNKHLEKRRKKNMTKDRKKLSLE
ncbi:ribosomal RNA processing protein 36 homolog [Teleopsis dalmanni]|uniref:ribosomal RNA processing protein 36 homolog n=1 Tax=Teleopsis dalmanni TaxID=139649 RepID=UPI0018CF4132|nr:ribosomal RNA processing protein 36 homolog [Teleopsis dalmanni]